MAASNRVGLTAPNSIGWVNGILITLLVALPTFFGWFGKTAEMGVLIVACSIALCFANLHRMQSFKGAGFEAQMRDAVEEAYATLDKLRELARPLVRANIANVTYAGRWDGIGREREHELMTELEKLLKSLGLSDDPSLEVMVRDFYNQNAADHLTFITEVMNRARIKNDVVAHAFSSMLTRTEDYVPPAGAIVRNAVLSLEANELAVIEPYIRDYEHYIKAHSFRRPEATSHEHLPHTFPTTQQAPHAAQ